MDLNFKQLIMAKKWKNKVSEHLSSAGFNLGMFILFQP